MEITPRTRVVVTGASRGIGRAIAQVFAARDCEVGLLARSEEELEELVLALPGEGHEALAADVTDPASLEHVLADWGDVDILVVNAGVADYGPFRDMTVAQVSIITNENTPNEKSETVRVPMRKAGELTLVKTFSMP